MRRTFSVVLGLALLLGSAAPTLAVKPAGNCPNWNSGFDLVDSAEWWARSVVGFETEGISVYVDGDPTNGFTAEFDEFASTLGFADGQAFHEFIVGEQWDVLDTNDDQFVCMKPFPHTPGNPAYLFSAVDNTTSG
jgi:hypothetical protein